MATSTNQFNTGKDCSVVIVHVLAPGGRLDLPLINDFDSKAGYHELKINALDGYTRVQHIPESLTLAFTVDRSNSNVDDFCSAIWKAYRVNGRVPDGTVYQYITEIDGSQTTLQYDGVAFKPEDLGNYKKESSVAQKMSGMAMDFKRV